MGGGRGRWGHEGHEMSHTSLHAAAYLGISMQQILHRTLVHLQGVHKVLCITGHS